MALKFIILATVLAVANAGIYGQPAAVSYAAPAAYHTAPVATYAAAPLVAKTAYASPSFTTFAAGPAYTTPYGTRTAYAAPAVATYAAAPAVHSGLVKTALPGRGNLIGIAYSSAPAVAHMTFTGYGINYAY